MVAWFAGSGLSGFDPKEKTCFGNTFASESMILLDSGNYWTVATEPLSTYCGLTHISKSTKNKSFFFITHPPRSPSTPVNICLVWVWLTMGFFTPPVPDWCEFLLLPCYHLYKTDFLSMLKAWAPGEQVSHFLPWLGVGSEASQGQACLGRSELLSKEQQFNEGESRRELKLHWHKTTQSPASSCWQAACWPLIPQDI